MTVDEELAQLEDNLRRLKIEYEIYFNGGSKRPPRDTLFRVDSTLKRFANEAFVMTAGQRFKFNQLVQRYAVHNDLWRRKLRLKEEGGSPGSAGILPASFPVMVTEAVVPSTGESRCAPALDALASVVLDDPATETEKLGQVVEALMAAELKVDQPAEIIDPLAIADQVLEHVQQVKESSGVEKVRVSVSVREGKVELDVTPG